MGAEWRRMDWSGERPKQADPQQLLQQSRYRQSTLGGVAVSGRRRRGNSHLRDVAEGKWAGLDNSLAMGKGESET